MKAFLVVLLLLAASALVFGMSVEEIGRLAELKTSDGLILQLIEKNGLDQPLTMKDVIYLREHGASETVIQYLLALSEPQKSSEQPAVQDESQKISENLRTYTTTTRNGRKVRVITNLDEKGKRMGGPIPPAPPEEVLYTEPPPPQEVLVTVRDERELRRDDYVYEDEPPPQSGMPLYNGGYYPQQYYPGFPVFPHSRHRCCPNPTSPNWRFNATVPFIRNHSPQRPPMPSRSRPASLPARPSR